MKNGGDALVFLSIGSNLGNRETAIKDAIRSIELLPGLKVERISPIYETEPWGYFDQELFLNCAIAVRTGRKPHDLFLSIKEIEQTMGRVKTERYHPRCIDIDILFFNRDIIDTALLKVPHPSLQDRLFVLVPLCDIAAEFIHPVFGETIQALLDRCSDKGGVRRKDLSIMLQGTDC